MSVSAVVRTAIVGLGVGAAAGPRPTHPSGVRAVRLPPVVCALHVESGMLPPTALCTGADDPDTARFRGTGTAAPIRIDNVATIAGTV